MDKFKDICLKLICLLFCVLESRHCISNSEQAVIKKILEDYDPNARPTEAIGKPVVVTFDLDLLRILDLDEKHEKLKTSVWYRLVWRDYRLSWRPEEYNNTKDIRLYSSRIWKPDIILFNDVTENHDRELDFMIPAFVKYDGYVQLHKPALYDTFCTMNVKYFPYDVQVCPLKFGSWTNDITHMLLYNWSDRADTSHLEKNAEWELLSADARLHVIKSRCCEEPFQFVAFHLEVRRRPLFYLFSLMVPFLFTTATAVLVFYLPPDSGEKVSLAITVLLSSTVFELILSEMMPPLGDQVPLVEKYIAMLMLLMSLATACTVLVLRLHHNRDKQPVPGWLRYVVLDRLAYILCLTDSVRALVEDEKNEKFQSEKIVLSDTIYQSTGQTTVSAEAPSEKPAQRDPVEIILTRIHSILQTWEEKKVEERRGGRESSAWVAVAMVIDRLFLIVFFILMALFMSLLMLGPLLALHIQ